MLFLVWCVCGGLLLHMFECNFLATLIKPNYETPVDKAEDVLDRGLNVLTVVQREGLVQAMKSSPSKITRDLAEATISPSVNIQILISSSYSSLELIVILGLE